MPRSRCGDRHAALFHVDEALARELPAVHALRHAQVVPEGEQVEGVAKGDAPLNDGWTDASVRCSYLHGSRIRTSDVVRSVQRDSEDNGENNEDAGDDALHDVGCFELAKLNEVFADPAVLRKRDKRHLSVRVYDGEFTSAIVKMALKPTPTMKTSRKTRCKLGWRFVSKMDKRSKPMPPTNDATIARQDSTRSRRRISAIKLHSSQLNPELVCLRL